MVLLALEGDLFFGIVEELEDNLQRIAEKGARVIILRLKRTHAIDATAAEALATFALQFQARGGRLMLAGLRPELHARILVSHLAEVVGAENVLLTDNRLLGSVRKAIERARKEIIAAARENERPVVRTASADIEGGASFSI
jgi:SulP family sulfate permease